MRGMYETGKSTWTETRVETVQKTLAKVFLEDWGGPRSPLALQFLHEHIIPDLLHCFKVNSDLLSNTTLAEIVEWKLKTQFGYPAMVSKGLAVDLLKGAQGVSAHNQITDPKEPWKRIFRLWVSGESLPNISEKTGYPLDYLDLLLIRFRKLHKFVGARSASLLECIQNEELREYGSELLTFIYQFNASLTAEPLYKEKLVLEQVIQDIGLPLEVSDLVAILEVIHAREGQLDIENLAVIMRDFNNLSFLLARGQTGLQLLPALIQALIGLHWLQENKAGKLTLSEKSAGTIAGFLLPKIQGQIQNLLAIQDMQSVTELILRQNSLFQVKLVEFFARELHAKQAVQLLTSLYKRANKQVDLQVLDSLGRTGLAVEFLMGCLQDRDSLVRAKTCEGIGASGSRAGIPALIDMLRDPVPGVRECAARGLGQLGATEAAAELQKLAGDYGESVRVRESAAEALRLVGFDL